MHCSVYLFKDGIGTVGHFKITLSKRKMVYIRDYDIRVKVQNKLCNVNLLEDHREEVQDLVEQIGNLVELSIYFYNVLYVE